uniref:Cytochrome b5 heme-binding domain-containing protein n=1 Tax=Globodera pallida TaxID=36090 RepID=A0A183CD85_GLOPA
MSEFTRFHLSGKKATASKATAKSWPCEEHLPIFTSDRLALHDGSDSSKPIYLAILGQVFDVDKGRKHYGMGGGYHFFAGKDATRTFVSGDFSSSGDCSDASELSESELLSVQDWITFYEREYRLVGLLDGAYYDRRGRPTEKLRQVHKRMEKAKQWKADQLREQSVFPPCNSEWKKGVGGRVWCTSKSGGMARDWVGVPRKLFNPGFKEHKCVCVKNFGPSLRSPDVDTGRGDLDHPSLVGYEECAPDSNSCRIFA